ncbi:glycosyltransferase [Methylomarinovum caldicuralii]|uniref:Glycosyltransferase n=1 Tax=Methylomarinovum caldicuralii TaxID=438856 RepID=A0AAU9CGK4_9GAMM|nr:glycosyltransferase family 2 protein [Methylomarinovum caldicuralii]BCX80686.1 glycosyltransferase [Methylomarinovum caldicuralii]
MSPKISVITAVFNGAETIEKCIESVHRQTYGNREHIIIDGGSTDGTVDILERHTPKLAYWVSEPDRGIYDAWNKALIHARGDWICFLGADDFLWDAKAMEKIIPYLQEAYRKSVKLVCGKVAVCDKSNNCLFYKNDSPGRIKKAMWSSMSIYHQGLLHHRSWFDKYGCFDSSFCVSGDYELLIRGWSDEEVIYADDVVFSGMGLGGVSSTHKGRMIIMRETWKIHRMHRIMPSAVFLSMVFGNYLRSIMISIMGERCCYFLLDAKRKLMGQPPYWSKLV